MRCSCCTAPGTRHCANAYEGAGGVCRLLSLPERIHHGAESMMTLGRRGFLRIAATAAAAAGGARVRREQNSPSLPTRVIAPTGAGGRQDVAARFAPERMRTPPGEPLIIDNV